MDNFKRNFSEMTSSDKKETQFISSSRLNTYARRIWIITGEKITQGLWWLLHVAGVSSLFSLSRNFSKTWNKRIHFAFCPFSSLVCCCYFLFLFVRFATKQRASLSRARINFQCWEKVQISRDKLTNDLTYGNLLNVERLSSETTTSTILHR